MIDRDGVGFSLLNRLVFLPMCVCLSLTTSFVPKLKLKL